MVWEVVLCGCKSALGVSIFWGGGDWGGGKGEGGCVSQY